jgi:hypothetical protein
MIEVIMVMVILTVIMGPIAAVTIIGYRSWTSATTTLSVSHDRQLLQGYFVRDAASATSFTVGQAGTCAPSGLTVTQWIASFKWNGQRTITGTWSHSYEADYVTTTIGTRPVLERWLCSDGATTPPTSAVATVAHSLSTSGTPVSVSQSGGSATIAITDAAGIGYSIVAHERSQ